MSVATRLVAILALGWSGVAACASQQPSPPQASPPSSTQPPTTTSPTGSPSTSTSTPECVGLSICAPPPPDAEGNPPCFYSDGWQARSSGAGIEVWYFHEPQNLSKAEKVTAVVRKKDGTNESQDANIEAGQQVHRFEFPTIDKSAVSAVFLDTSNGRCFVIGPGS
ncbi:hypothetical protein [Mycobacterium decipiens]|uniref:DUF3558 domain-containing protein n=1 Tax=Mycobacterium decipiens TaxID=1430326 RepID=A0A1X2LQ47_9MYCO|nr:hypothetical protein [Mycobacterium decipiens]OSC38483.1 hypothetical protein B8W66_20240 [Mycobacterium decipiens]